MGVKEDITRLLEENRGKYISGAEIAEKLGCTRGAVWKAVNALRKSGYCISAVTNRGYRLNDNTDVLSEGGICALLENPESLCVQVYRCTDSTNARLRELASLGVGEGTVVIAGKQTAGRGRLGRSFFSPSDTGLYMSLLLRPQISANDAVKITSVAAVAVAESIDFLSGEHCGIKWVNDIYLHSKKVCGILTEAAFGLENGSLEYAVLGIGVNVYTPENGFPDELGGIAAAVFQKRESNMRNRLAAQILNRFMKYYSQLSAVGKFSCLEQYRSRLMWRGERVNVISAKGTFCATLVDVDEQCRLIVKKDDGSESRVSSGEISIRRV